jgi:hypothetical protein
MALDAAERAPSTASVADIAARVWKSAIPSIAITNADIRLSLMSRSVPESDIDGVGRLSHNKRHFLGF